jgi:hypothetical protein
MYTYTTLKNIANYWLHWPLHNKTSVTWYFISLEMICRRVNLLYKWKWANLIFCPSCPRRHSAYYGGEAPPPPRTCTAPKYAGKEWGTREAQDWRTVLRMRSWQWGPQKRRGWTFCKMSKNFTIPKSTIKDYSSVMTMAALWDGQQSCQMRRSSATAKVEVLTEIIFPFCDHDLCHLVTLTR